jgi:hypothetical protein
MYGAERHRRGKATVVADWPPPPHIWTCEMFKSITALANAAQPISKVEMKVLCSTGHGPSLIASSLGHGPSPALASLCVDGFLAFRGQLSQPQINLKMNDEPEPKPPAINIFSILVRPNVPTLVPVVVKNRMCDLRWLRGVAALAQQREYS